MSAISAQPAAAAASLYDGLGFFYRRLRQTRAEFGSLSLPESSALGRLGRSGPMTATALAKLEQISAQSVGSTVAALEARGLIARTPDPLDGRRSILSITEAGAAARDDRRAAKYEHLAEVLAEACTEAELALLAEVGPLLERIGERL